MPTGRSENRHGSFPTALTLPLFAQIFAVKWPPGVELGVHLQPTFMERGPQNEHGYLPLKVVGVVGGSVADKSHMKDNDYILSAFGHPLFLNSFNSTKQGQIAEVEALHLRAREHRVGGGRKPLVW